MIYKSLRGVVSRVLSCKHKDLSSVPRTHAKKWRLVVHICNITGEAETGRSLELTGQPA